MRKEILIYFVLSAICATFANILVSLELTGTKFQRTGTRIAQKKETR